MFISIILAGNSSSIPVAINLISEKHRITHHGQYWKQLIIYQQQLQYGDCHMSKRKFFVQIIVVEMLNKLYSSTKDSITIEAVAGVLLLLVIIDIFTSNKMDNPFDNSLHAEYYRRIFVICCTVNILMT